MAFGSVQPRFSGSPSWSDQGTTLHNNDTEERKTLPSPGLPQRSPGRRGLERRGSLVQMGWKGGQAVPTGQLVNPGRPPLQENRDALGHTAILTLMDGLSDQFPNPELALMTDITLGHSEVKTKGPS